MEVRPVDFRSNAKPRQFGFVQDPAGAGEAHWEKAGD
jgi:hypothetical protein